MWNGLAPIVPDSYTSTRSGLWTIRASSAAVLGRPTPMNTVLVLRSRRAATIVWSSPEFASWASAVAVSTVMWRRPP